MAYSKDLRERVIAYKEAGNSLINTALVFGIHHKTVRNWVQLKVETGKLTPRAFAGARKPQVSESDLQVYLEQHPNSTLQVIAKHFDLTIPGISYHLHKHGYVKKKLNDMWSVMK